MAKTDIPADSTLTFAFDDVSYRVDVASLTVDEWIELEEHGIEFSGGKSLKVLKGIAWVAVNRERPEVTFDDIGRVAMLQLIESPSVEPSAVVEGENPTSPVRGS